jgi:hypothetical protein
LKFDEENHEESFEKLWVEFLLFKVGIRSIFDDLELEEVASLPWKFPRDFEKIF